MAKYLTEFSSNTAYNAALATLDYPNVSLVENQLVYAESLPTMYRWVDDGDNTRCGDEDGCTLYQQTKKQMSIDGGQTWSDVVPAEYGYGHMIEEDSQECGCGEGDCENGVAWEWHPADYYNSSRMAVIALKLINPNDGSWEDWADSQEVFDFDVCEQCNESGCPVLKVKLRMSYDDLDGEFLPEVKIYTGCDCVDGECPNLEDTLHPAEGEQVYFYDYYDDAMIDSMHIYDNVADIPGLYLHIGEGNCIDNCDDYGM